MQQQRLSRLATQQQAAANTGAGGLGENRDPDEGPESLAAPAQPTGPKWGNFRLLGRLRSRGGGGAAAATRRSNAVRVASIRQRQPRSPASPGRQPEQRRAFAPRALRAGSQGGGAAPPPAAAGGSGRRRDDGEEALSPREDWRQVWVRQRDRRKDGELDRLDRLNAAASMIQVRCGVGRVGCRAHLGW
jgi:hypothetical protein